MESQSNLDFLFKIFLEHICKMTDESNFIHSTTLCLGCAVCKEKYYAMGVGQGDCNGSNRKKKAQKAMPSLSVSCY